MENIIEVQDLYKTYGDVVAVDRLSFSVKRNSLFAFLGLNGAGKSTTINILCAILKKNSGTVRIDGHNLDRESARIKSKLGIVFQGSVLDAQLSVLDNLKSRAALYGMTKAETAGRIEYVNRVMDLGDIIKRDYGKLSGGQKRRVDIARALIHEPKILFLDEPTTGLDPSTRVKVWQTVRSLLDENGLTVFLTTHYMEEAVRADDVVILDAGKIVAAGSPDSLKSAYATDFLRLIGDRSAEAEALFSAENKRFEYRNNSYYVSVESCQAALKFVNTHKKICRDFEILKGDMDSVFLNVTGKKLEG
ncbi:MAG: ABC transporter ATP-binding protein [Clostridiales bacterium]|nr:ABC transporter ATP-binding protein [Clostridiales bacterium]